MKGGKWSLACEGATRRECWARLLAVVVPWQNVDRMATWKGA